MPEGDFLGQARRADLLRERRAGVTARPMVLTRIIARIPRFPSGAAGAARVSSHAAGDWGIQHVSLVVGSWTLRPFDER